MDVQVIAVEAVIICVLHHAEMIAQPVAKVIAIEHALVAVLIHAVLLVEIIVWELALALAGDG